MALFVTGFVLFLGLFRFQCAHFLARRIHDFFGNVDWATGSHGNCDTVAGPRIDPHQLFDFAGGISLALWAAIVV